MSILKIADRTFHSRLFTGTGKFPSPNLMEDSLVASESELVTVSLKRVDLKHKSDSILTHLKKPYLHLLPNTSGVRTAKEAIFVAHIAREALQTSWIKLEIHPDPRTLLPDPIETLEAAKELVKQNFIVLPYIHADPILCKRLEDVGVQTVMPLGSPIGSNEGLQMESMLKIIINQSQVPVIIDAGIGRPSQAAQAMELGADAVLVNTAIAVANKPIEMAIAFKEAVIAGRRGFEAGLGSQGKLGESTSSLTAFLDD